MSEIKTSELPPCPFCGSAELSTGLWTLDSGEVDAIECLHCYAGAPLSIWKTLSDRSEIQ